MTFPETHPDDARLSALAGADPEAASDAALRSHVGGCDRCAQLVDDLSRLRAALATMPDVAPPRPLRLLPAAAEREPSFAERAATLVRRIFAPVLAAGAAAALVGAVGTAGDVGLFGMPASGGAAAPAADRELAQGAGDAAAEPAATAAAGVEVYTAGDDSVASPGVAPEQARVKSTHSTSAPASVAAEANEGDGDFAEMGGAEPARSPWPMVLFGGVTLIIAALLLRWILQPRAG